MFWQAVNAQDSGLENKSEEEEEEEGKGMERRGSLIV